MEGMEKEKKGTKSPESLNGGLLTNSVNGAIEDIGKIAGEAFLSPISGVFDLLGGLFGV